MVELMKQITAWEIFDIELEEVTLLSIEEYKKYKNIIPLLEKWWWLRSPGFVGYYPYYVADVDCVGDVAEYGSYIGVHKRAVRPALKIKTSEVNCFDIGDTISFPKDHIGDEYIVLDKLPNNILYILSKDIVSIRRFDPESNVWETSELKQWLEEQYSWMKEDNNSDMLEEVKEVLKKVRESDDE